MLLAVVAVGGGAFFLLSGGDDDDGDGQTIARDGGESDSDADEDDQDAGDDGDDGSNGAPGEFDPNDFDPNDFDFDPEDFDLDFDLDDFDLDFDIDDYLQESGPGSGGPGGTGGADPPPFDIDATSTMDHLANDCYGGDMRACDTLYDASPLGSDHEDYGDTCGGRLDYSALPSCVAVLG